MKNKFIIIVLFLVFTPFFLTGCDDQASDSASTTPVSSSSSDNLMTKVVQQADKIEVVHFHATQQCWSCTTVGKYALRNIQEKFPEEYKDGIIVFKDINGELPENREMVIKYQARGSSLFVNAITNDQDNIGEDTRVWRLVSDETQFINYFENKLKELLG